MRFATSHLRGDLFGGITAGIVALPLALALGVASGMGPVAGLYGAILVGFFAALFRVVAGLGRQHEHWHELVVVERAQLAHERNTVHAGHVDVRQHEVRGILFRELQRFDAVGRLHHFVAGAFQGEAHHLAHRSRIVNRKDYTGHSGKLPKSRTNRALRATADPDASKFEFLNGTVGGELSCSPRNRAGRRAESQFRYAVASGSARWICTGSDGRFRGMS